MPTEYDIKATYAIYEAIDNYNKELMFKKNSKLGNTHSREKEAFFLIQYYRKSKR